MVETSSPLPTISVESNNREEKDGEKEKEREGERDCCDGGEIDRTAITGTKTELGSSLQTIRVEGIDGGIKEDEDKSHEQQLSRDILFYKQSQTQLKQVHVHDYHSYGHDRKFWYRSLVKIKITAKKIWPGDPFPEIKMHSFCRC